MVSNSEIRKHTSFIWISLLLASLLMLLSACGSSDTTSTSPTATPTIATSAPTPTDTPTPLPTPAPTDSGTNTASTILITTSASGNYTFSPATLTVTVGTTVTWRNNTRAPHTVTSDDGKTFDSGNQPVAAGGTFSFTFKTVGSYSYHCNFHPSMMATIVVK